MGRWQRIGAVISVLWLIGSPLYLLVTENEPADRSYAACIEDSLANPLGCGRKVSKTRLTLGNCILMIGACEPLDTCRRLASLTLSWKETTIAPCCGASSWGQSRCYGLSEAS
jgi:hypothetical protein